MSSFKEQYHQYLLSPYWRSFRRNLLMDIKDCFVCDSTHQLEIHHIRYALYHERYGYDITILCHECHRKAHRVLGVFKIALTPKALSRRLCFLRAYSDLGRGRVWGFMTYMWHGLAS